MDASKMHNPNFGQPIKNCLQLKYTFSKVEVSGLCLQGLEENFKTQVKNLARTAANKPSIRLQTCKIRSLLLRQVENYYEASFNRHLI